MSVVFFGTPRFSMHSLEALIEAGEKISGVVTRPDVRRGRGAKTSPSPVKEYALGKGLGVIEPMNLKDPLFMDEIAGIGPEFLVVVAYGRILPPPVLEIPSIASINLHASLLPKYRGASPIAWAILNGETETGLTTMLMSSGLDEGEILIQERHEILEDDTTQSLGERLSRAGGPLLVRTLRGMRDGAIKATPQVGLPSYAPLLKKMDGRVDWLKTARDLHNFVRAMYPWPGAFCEIEGERVRLIGVRPEEGKARSGVIVSVGQDSFLVGTSEGLISVLEVQPEGRRPMTGGAFIRGRSLRAGDRLS